MPSPPQPHPSPPAPAGELLCMKLLPQSRAGLGPLPGPHTPSFCFMGSPEGPTTASTHTTPHTRQMEGLHGGGEACDEDEICEGGRQCWLTGDSILPANPLQRGLLAPLRLCRRWQNPDRCPPGGDTREASQRYELSGWAPLPRQGWRPGRLWLTKCNRLSHKHLS